MIQRQADLIELTSLSNEDIERLAVLLQRVVDDGASIGFLSPLAIEDALDYWCHALQPGALLWAVQANNQYVATVQLQLAQKNNGLHRAEVAKLMVHPDYRRNGYARLLMEKLEQRAVSEQRTLLVLDTRAGDPSNRLYQSLGFQHAGVIPKFALSSNGQYEDTVLYYKELT